jgi:acyl carrier protein
MLFEKAQQMIAEELSVDPSEVKPESRLVEDLRADSLNIVELVMELEQQFDIEIPDDDMPKLVTVQDIVNYVEAHNG